ncbi:MAG: hypothetical protein WCO72_09890 [Betaproteobacteria bacterium]
MSHWTESIRSSREFFTYLDGSFLPLFAWKNIYQYQNIVRFFKRFVQANAIGKQQSDEWFLNKLALQYRGLRVNSTLALTRWWRQIDSIYFNGLLMVCTNFRFNR